MAVRNPTLRRRGSAKQVLVLGVILGICVVAAAMIISMREKSHQAEAKKWAMQRFGLLSATTNSLHDEYQDADQDMVADPPVDQGQWIKPETLRFSYVASEGPEGQAETWQSLIDAIAAATGLSVEFHPVTDIDEQLALIKSGELHITGLNTGSVPRAVNACGFVPVCTLAAEGAEIGVRSVIIVPTGSSIKRVGDLKGKLIMFTSQGSNSGFKAPMALLSKELGMNPAIDYEFGFAGSHAKAIAMIASKEAEVAAVASDLIDRAVQNGVLSEDEYRIVYESERFPSAAFGYVHNLSPELATQIREVLMAFKIEDPLLSVLFPKMPAAIVVPVTYKDDWALIRRIDNSLGVVHTVELVPTEES